MTDKISSLPINLPALTASINQSQGKDSPQKIKDAAQQFEALMLGELLKTAREAGSSSGWMGTGEEDQAGQTGLDMAEQQFASMMAKNGGLGLTRFIVQGLERKP
jgi:Rod binding domain-containing protein